MLVPYFPYPLISGGQNRTFNLLKHLSKKHQVTLVCYIKEEREKQYIKNIQRYCYKIITIKRTKKAWELQNILRAGFSLFPFVIALYLKQEARKKLAAELKKEKYDVIHAETFYVMPNIPETKTPILLVEQTVEYPTYEDYCRSLPWYLFPVKLLLWIDIYKIRFWEKYYWNKAQGLVTVSEDDKRFINTIFPKLSISVIANGVDIEKLSKTKRELNKRPTVLFIGQFKWLPNIDGAKWLIKTIWPLIVKKVPKAQLLIVGRNPTEELIALGAKGPGTITIRGDVEDIREAYGQANLLLASIRSGHGTKYKVLEAMATRTPIVGTSLALEGLEIQNGSEALVHDSPEELAEAVVGLLKDTEKADQMATKAYRFIRHTYNWESVYSHLDGLYAEISKAR